MGDTRLAVRRLGPADEKNLVAYLEQDPTNNLFHLANLDQLNIKHPDLHYFGAFDGSGTLVGEIMLMRKNAGIFWHDPAALPLFKEIVTSERVSAISGSRVQVEPLLNLLPAGSIRKSIKATYAHATADGLIPWPKRGERLATPDDVDLLADLCAHNILFSSLQRVGHRDRVELALKTGGLISLIERDGIAVAAARTSAIGHGMAMIGGVLTLPAYRRQGFARACTGLLSRRLIEMGVTPHLTYDHNDPAARRTYLDLGFQTIGEWTIAFLTT